MSAAVAWIVPLPGDLRVAVGTLEFVHVLTDAPARTAIVNAPVYMNEALSWDGNIVPVFDAGKFSEGLEKSSSSVYYGIVRYRPTEPGRQQFGALKMTAIPQRIAVDDQMACELPNSYQRWRPFCISCFELDGHPVPVLHLARLFSQAPVDSGIRAEADSSGDGSRAASGRNGPDLNGYTDSLATT